MLGDTPLCRNPHINRLPPSTPSSSQRATNAQTPSVPGGMPQSPPSGGPRNGDDKNDKFEPNNEDDWIRFQEVDNRPPDGNDGPPDGNNGPLDGNDDGPPDGDNNGPPDGNNGDHQDQGNNGPPDGDDGPPEGNNNFDESSESDGPGPVRHRHHCSNYEDQLATVLESFADTLDGRQQNQDHHNKAQVLDVFDRSSPEKLKTFITQCQLYFRSNLKSCTTDESCVNFAMTYLTGTQLV